MIDTTPTVHGIQLPKTPRVELFVLTIRTDQVEEGMIVSVHTSPLSAQKAAVNWMQLYYEKELRIWEGGYYDDLDYGRLKEIESDTRFSDEYHSFAIDIWQGDSYGNLAYKVE